MKLIVFCLALFGLCFSVVVPVLAQMPQAEQAQRHFDRGSVAVEMAQSRADLEAAAGEFEEATVLAPDWPDAHYNLGLVREKLDDLDGAIASLKRYLELSPQASDAGTVKSQLNKLEFKREKMTELSQIPVLLDGVWNGAIPFCGGWSSELSFHNQGNGEVVVKLPVTWNADRSRSEDVQKIRVLLDGKSVKFGFRAKSVAAALNYTGYCDVQFDMNLIEKGLLKGRIIQGPNAPPNEIVLKKM